MGFCAANISLIAEDTKLRKKSQRLILGLAHPAGIRLVQIVVPDQMQYTVYYDAVKLQRKIRTISDCIRRYRIQTDYDIGRDSIYLVICNLLFILRSIERYYVSIVIVSQIYPLLCDFCSK